MPLQGEQRVQGIQPSPIGTGLDGGPFRVLLAVGQWDELCTRPGWVSYHITTQCHNPEDDNLNNFVGCVYLALLV